MQCKYELPNMRTEEVKTGECAWIMGPIKLRCPGRLCNRHRINLHLVTIIHALVALRVLHNTQQETQMVLYAYTIFPPPDEVSSV